MRKAVVWVLLGTSLVAGCGGKPFVSNASIHDPLAFERLDDITTVKLGDTERYDVPDALLTGG